MKTMITKADAMKLKLRYNRGDQNAVIGAAVRLAATTGEARYVVPTYFGFAIESSRPTIQVPCFVVTWANDVATVETVR